ncbi:hypothetical protein IG631_07581 [Alternaria alternata]|nr:hypothetical protein IG631_07581 [Alternaria alternata]
MPSCGKAWLAELHVANFTPHLLGILASALSWDYLSEARMSPRKAMVWWPVRAPDQRVLPFWPWTSARSS